MLEVFKKHGRLAFFLLLFAMATVGLAGDPPDPVGVITQEDFTELATQILTYLGYAIAAGLGVLVMVIGARRAWSFFRRFF